MDNHLARDPASSDPNAPPILPSPSLSPSCDDSLAALVEAPVEVSDGVPVEVRTRARRVGGRSFIPVVFQAPALGSPVHVHRLSTREAKFIRRLLDTGSLALAAEEVGVTKRAALAFSRKRNIQAYLHDMLAQKALAAGLTIEKLLAKLNLAIDGSVILSDPQLDAIKTAARILRPSDGGSPQVSIGSVSVNTQNNFQAGGPSPYAALTREELLLELRSAVQDIAGV